MIDTLKGIDTTTSRFADEIKWSYCNQLSEIGYSSALFSKAHFRTSKRILDALADEYWKFAKIPYDQEKVRSLRRKSKLGLPNPPSPLSMILTTSQIDTNYARTSAPMHRVWIPCFHLICAGGIGDLRRFNDKPLTFVGTRNTETRI